MSLNAVFQGPPANVPSPGAAAALGLDEVNGNLYYTSPQSSGWQSITTSISKSVALAQAANNANLLTYTVPATGLYRVDYYSVSTNTPTGATLPNASVVFTDTNTGASTTAATADLGSVSAANTVNSGSVIVNAKVGTTIVVSTANYAAGSGTALAYNAKSRIEYLG